MTPIEKLTLITAERRFLIERTYQFINFGIVTLGLGMAACYSQYAQAHRRELGVFLCVLFVGASTVGAMSWLNYRRLRKLEAELAAETTIPLPDYWWLFVAGIGFGVLAALSFLYIAFAAPTKTTTGANQALVPTAGAAVSAVICVTREEVCDKEMRAYHADFGD